MGVMRGNRGSKRTKKMQNDAGKKKRQQQKAREKALFDLPELMSRYHGLQALVGGEYKGKSRTLLNRQLNTIKRLKASVKVAIEVTSARGLKHGGRPAAAGYRDFLALITEDGKKISAELAKERGKSANSPSPTISL